MTETTVPTLIAEGLIRRFGKRQAVAGVNLRLNRGDILGFLGVNGAGKSTTMRMLAGELAPAGGTVSVAGHDMARQPLAAKALIGYLPEIPPLYKDLSVDQMLGLSASLHRVPHGQVADKVARARSRCGLDDMGRRLIGHLSKGYQQRVGIAQAIVHEPPLVILDEPTVGLDPQQIRQVRDLIRQLGKEAAVILSTHILSEVEAVCNRVEILHEGKIVYGDSLKGHAQKAQHRLTATFKRPPPLPQLAMLDGVVEAKQLPGGRFDIGYRQDAPPNEAIVQAAGKHNWGLIEITPQRSSLEETFLQLTGLDPELLRDTPTGAAA